MNQGFINRIERMIEAIKAELIQKRAGHPDSQLSQEEEDGLLEQLGTLIELKQQFEE